MARARRRDDRMEEVEVAEAEGRMELKKPMSTELTTAICTQAHRAARRQSSRLVRLVRVLTTCAVEHRTSPIAIALARDLRNEGDYQ